MTVRASLAIALLIAACSAPPKPAPTAAAAPPPPPKGVGSSCTPQPTGGQSDCPTGLTCAPYQGGMCVVPCGVGMTMCPGGTACVETALEGELCMKFCTQTSECRASEGYTCDAAWQACVPPAVAALRAPGCPNVPDPPRGVFPTAQQITSSKGPGTNHVEPAAALDAKGTLGILFVAGAPYGQPNTLGTTAILARGVIEPEIELRSTKQHYASPWVAADRRGLLHAVWLADAGGIPANSPAIEYATSTDGKAWAPARVVQDITDCPDGQAGCLDKPMIAIGPDAAQRGKEAIWIFYVSTVKPGLRVIKSTDGGKTFLPSVPVAAAGYADVDVATDGSIRVAYVTGPPGANAYGQVGTKIELVTSTDGGATWGTPVVASRDEEPIPFLFANPQVAYDVARKLTYVAYPVGAADGHWDLWLVALAKDGAATRTRVNDDAACAAHMLPAMALDTRTGKVHLIWNENRGSIGRVVYAACATGGASCTPNESVSDRPFGSFSFGRHTTKAQGSYNALILDAKRRVLRALWTQTVDEGFGPVGRLYEATGKLR